MIDEPLSTFTIGFTKTTAKDFFGRIRRAGATVVLDVRLNNTSQLSGFAKSEDLSFFLKEISGVAYRHMPILAPEGDKLTDYRKGGLSWQQYQAYFLDLMRRRKIQDVLSPQMFEGACLLCSEDTPHQCHRRLVCEYLNSHWDNKLRVKHL